MPGCQVVVLTSAINHDSSCLREFKVVACTKDSRARIGDGNQWGKVNGALHVNEADVGLWHAATGLFCTGIRIDGLASVVVLLMCAPAELWNE